MTHAPASPPHPFHILVLMGGWSAEREVSLSSGNGVADALERKGYKVTRLDMTRNLAQDITTAKPYLVFNALHGTPGEDGSVQGMLDLMGVKYTHSGMVTSVIAIDKLLTKQALVPHDIPMPGGHVVQSASLYSADPLPRPYVLKPLNEGSSVGVAIVREGSAYGNPISPDSSGPWQHFETLLAEPFINGRELTVSVLNNKPLCVTELEPKSGFYDFDAKYTDGMTQHICPAHIPDDIAQAMMELAQRAHMILGCKGASRSDFRWDDTQGLAGIYLLEVNTQPGMTPLSLVPEQAKYLGISYDDLVEALVQEALGIHAPHASKG
jgi:D-alanine-D-alanine ligase